MPRIIVTSDHAARDREQVLLDEHVRSAQLSEDRHSLQFIERLGWAISDAEDAAPADSEFPSSTGTPRARSASHALRTPKRGRPGARRAGSVVASLLPRAAV